MQDIKDTVFYAMKWNTTLLLVFFFSSNLEWIRNKSWYILSQSSY